MRLELGLHVAGPADFHGTSHEWYVRFAGIDPSAVLLLGGGDPGLELTSHRRCWAVTSCRMITPPGYEEFVDLHVVLLMVGRICNVVLDFDK